MNGRRRVGSTLAATIVVCLVACQALATPQMTEEEVRELTADLERVRGDLDSAIQEDAALAGGLVKTLIQLRIAMLRNTEAMLDQKLLANEHGVTLNYTLEREVYVPPPPDPVVLAEIEASIAEAEADVDAARAEDAKYAGGLVKAMAAARVATAANTLAMLQQRWYAHRHSIPYATLDANPTAPIAAGDGSSATSPPSAPAPAEPAVETTEMDARFTERNDTWWRWAYKVTVRNKSTQTVTLDRICVRAADGDGFTIDEDTHYGVSIGPNQTRELTGYVLIDASSAPRVEQIGVSGC